MSLEEYEILGIIGDITSSTFKVQNKITKAIFMWHAVDCSLMNDAEKQNLLKKLNERRSLSHPNLLKFYNHVEHADSKVLYISTEYCKIGNLKKIICDCLKKSEGLKEELIVRIMYQVCVTLKTSKTTIRSVNIENIFFDDDYNVKFFNFDTYNDQLQKEKKMFWFETLVSQICTLNLTDSCSFGECAKMEDYSDEFCMMLKCLSSINTSENQFIDSVLCHPTVLLLSSKWSKEACFYKKQDNKTNKLQHEEDTSNNDCVEMSQKLRKWEASLKVRENRLKERELALIHREKKVTLLERTTREKLAQAELYLKRCRETRSSSSGSSKSSIKTQKLCYEHLDTSLSADCGDSVIIPTSQKLNVSKIIKPSPFIRTLSERKVRFKGHSPLKEIDYSRRRYKPVLKEYILPENICTSKQTLLNKIEHEDPDKSRPSDSKENICKSRKLFRGSSNDSKFKKHGSMENDIDCRPISWTEESKKQAFDLLRAMNGAINENHLSGEIKHTYL